MKSLWNCEIKVNSLIGTVSLNAPILHSPRLTFALCWVTRLKWFSAGVYQFTMSWHVIFRFISSETQPPQRLFDNSFSVWHSDLNISLSMVHWVKLAKCYWVYSFSSHTALMSGFDWWLTYLKRRQTVYIERTSYFMSVWIAPIFVCVCTSELAQTQDSLYTLQLC